MRADGRAKPRSERTGDLVTNGSPLALAHPPIEAEYRPGLIGSSALAFERAAACARGIRDLVVSKFKILRQMEPSHVRLGKWGDYDELLEWCRVRRAILLDDLKPLESGQSKLGENNGSGWRDVTPDWIKTTRARIADLDRLIAAYEQRNSQRPQTRETSPPT